MTAQADAAKLLRAAYERRRRPCRVGRSPRRTVIDAMQKQGGSAKLVSAILRDEFKELIATASLDRHRAKECLCYRDGYHLSAARVRR